MKLFLDENLSPKLVEQLQAAGYDAVCALGVKLSGKSDDAIRHFCIREQRILVTLDADFGNILRFPPSGTPGIIWLKADVFSHHDISILLSGALAQLRNQELRDMLAVVDRKTIRIRPGILSS